MPDGEKIHRRAVRVCRVARDLRHRGNREIEIDREDRRGLDQLANRGKNLDWIVADIWVYRRPGGKRTARCHQDCIAIRVGLGDELAADTAAGAAAVFYNDRLAEHSSQPFGNNTRHPVSRTSGRERHNDLNGPGRIGLRVGRCGTMQHPSTQCD